MRIAVDAMGGDHAPDDIIKGAVEAQGLLDKDDELILIGIEDVIRSKLADLDAEEDKITIVHAPDIIGMEESPVESLRKKRKSSIAVMAKLAAREQTDAVISAGNTGASVAAFQIRMRNLEGVNRPAIAAVLPTLPGPVIICDAGANVACRPINLYQNAVMSSVYSQRILEIDRPRVGLMNIGGENAKGNELVKKTRELLLADEELNFIGNLEGHDIFDGVCDVAICEGFLGNVVLKLTEGLVDMIFKAVKLELLETDKRLAMEFKPLMEQIYKKYDYHEYGGALLLGVNGTAVICHGASRDRSIKNAIMASKKFYTMKINDQIVEHLSNVSVNANEE